MPLPVQFMEYQFKGNALTITRGQVYPEQEHSHTYHPTWAQLDAITINCIQGTFRRIMPTTTGWMVAT